MPRYLQTYFTFHSTFYFVYVSLVIFTCSQSMKHRVDDTHCGPMLVEPELLFSDLLLIFIEDLFTIVKVLTSQL